MSATPTHHPRLFRCSGVSVTAEEHCACVEASINIPLWQNVPDAWEIHPSARSASIGDVVGGHCVSAEMNTDSWFAHIQSDTGTSPNKHTALGGLWQQASGSQVLALMDTYAAVFSSYISGHIVVLNSAAQRLLDGFTHPAILTQAASFVPESSVLEVQRVACQLAELGLLQPVDGATARTSVKSRTLSAWLHLTDTCNLHCSYCYVTESAAQMNKGTGRAAIDAILRSALRNDYRAVKLKYAGGEPTLCFDLVRSLHAYAAAQAKESGIALQEVILSNGVVLTSGMLDFLKSEDIRQMISLDGLGPDHDGQRPFKNGAPSSRYVLQALDRAVAQGVRPHISISVRPSNVASLAETVRFVLDRDLLFNLNFVREALPASSEWETEFITGIRSALTVIEARLPKRRLIDGLLDRCNFAGAHDYPCGAGRDYMAVTPHGKVARCHVTLSQPVGDIWAEDPLEAVRATAGNTEFQALSADARTECRNCTWRSVCAGGCPLQTVRTKGREDVASPYCNIYRAILPELVRLEGLRILKWESAN